MVPASFEESPGRWAGWNSSSERSEPLFSLSRPGLPGRQVQRPTHVLCASGRVDRGTHDRIPRAESIKGLFLFRTQGPCSTRVMSHQ